MIDQTKSSPDTEEITCPFCGEKAKKENFSFECNSDEQIVLHLNLFDVFKYIQEQDEKIEEFIALLKDLAFKNEKED